ncbi:MAG: saccharopine dehydrogenase NADP-binding domain-containing protein [Pseudomonadota bacterium]
MQRQYDIIVFGATGFTGQLVAEYMTRQYTGGNLTWAMAGRNTSKLESVRDKVGAQVELLQADAQNYEQLAELVQQARVVLTTVGPYARYGSELVAACAAHGTHYCDLTGEVHWMRKMITEHQAAAQESGARIVHTCGFDSIPSDLGVYFLQQHMRAQHGVPAKEVKYRAKAFKGGFSGGTIDSMMAMMEASKTDPSIKEIIADPYSLNDKHRGLDGLDHNRHYYDRDFKSWVGPFVMAAINTRVVRRSNELLNMAYGEDFCYNEGVLTQDGIGGLMSAAALGMGSSAMNSMAALEPARKMMQSFLPKPGEGPTRTQIEEGLFEIELVAKHPDDYAKDLRATVKGDRDPGYGSTAKMLSESAVCLAQDDLEVTGGFWTPASAMGDTLIQRLSSNAGVTFELH